MVRRVFICAYVDEFSLLLLYMVLKSFYIYEFHVYNAHDVYNSKEEYRLYNVYKIHIISYTVIIRALYIP